VCQTIFSCQCTWFVDKSHTLPVCLISTTNRIPPFQTLSRRNFATLISLCNLHKNIALYTRYSGCLVALTLDVGVATGYGFPTNHRLLKKICHIFALFLVSMSPKHPLFYPLYYHSIKQ